MIDNIISAPKTIDSAAPMNYVAWWVEKNNTTLRRGNKNGYGYKLELPALRSKEKN